MQQRFSTLWKYIFFGASYDMLSYQLVCSGSLGAEFTIRKDRIGGNDKMGLEKMAENITMK